MKITKCCLWQIKSPKKCIRIYSVYGNECNPCQITDDLSMVVVVVCSLKSHQYVYVTIDIGFYLIWYSEISLDALLCHVCERVYERVCIFYLNFWQNFRQQSCMVSNQNQCPLTVVVVFSVQQILVFLWNQTPANDIKCTHFVCILYLK